MGNLTQKIHKIFLTLLKNACAFLVGGFVGILTAIIFAKPLLERSVEKDVGLGVIAVAPIMIIFYAILFGASGGILGIVIYNLVKFYGKKR